MENTTKNQTSTVIDPNIANMHNVFMIEPHSVDACEGCLALTKACICDLGNMTETICHQGTHIKKRPVGKCMKPITNDEYIIAHLLNI